MVGSPQLWLTPRPVSLLGKDAGSTGSPTSGHRRIPREGGAEAGRRSGAGWPYQSTLLRRCGGGGGVEGGEQLWGQTQGPR